MALRINPKHYVLHTPPDANGEPVVYGLGMPLQIGERYAAVFVNRKYNGDGIVDLEDGNDLIIFDSLGGLSAENAIRISRTTQEVLCCRDGQEREMALVNYPVATGFVPRGALREDGSPHPHAGTGFVVVHAIAHEAVPQDVLNDPAKLDDWQAQVRAKKQKRDWPPYQHLEVQQHTFDGKRHAIVSSKRFQPEDLLPPHVFDGYMSLTTATSDGDDLLLGAREHMTMNAGVIRWRRSDDAWRPHSYASISSEETNTWNNSLEPTATRGADGSLYFTVRNAAQSPHKHSFRVWRSSDNGASWTQTLDRGHMHEQTTTTINTAGDGTTYIASSPYNGKDVPYSRSKLMLWALSDDGESMEEPVVLFDSDVLPRYDDMLNWWLDHPTGATVRLADGKWRHLLTHRVMSESEVRGFTRDVRVESGFYIHEVESDRPAIPAWRFR